MNSGIDMAGGCPYTVRMAKDARFELRCSKKDKDLMQKAADLDERTLSAWVLRVAVREARRIMKKGAE